MRTYEIREVDSSDPAIAAELHRFNSLAPDTFPPLEARHLENGYWWIISMGTNHVGFCGLVPFDPFPNVGFLKRCWIDPDARGHGLHVRSIFTRETRARELKWSMLVGECDARNLASVYSHQRSGFAQIEPEQKWGSNYANAIYWAKTLA